MDNKYLPADHIPRSKSISVKDCAATDDLQWQTPLLSCLCSLILFFSLLVKAFTVCVRGNIIKIK